MLTPTANAKQNTQSKKPLTAYIFVLAVVASFFGVVSYNKIERGPDWRTVARNEVQAQRQAALQKARTDTASVASEVNRKPKL
ncbi:hypothetical protein [Varunaivibrio sulfuroxidans]|uniref:Uncharacterized protein n=1 Tax=Varunaivibrio sulfuroxidans TaxID=1773489 RepID=A0A4R3JF97_9PROT|nr:hypothetical protein [Varunaivibrio sulfuroxidans]TCS64799.1 hypothetical protein EDD55_101128 [Varunaivibrio sulfuroxidans]WES29898.1 hypothetical protein P3M64_09630 [Varunaivibrio sulfuroxidans]